MICINNLGLVLIYTYIMLFKLNVACKSRLCDDYQLNNSNLTEQDKQLISINKTESLHMKKSDKHLNAESFIHIKVLNNDKNNKTELRHNQLTVIKTDFNHNNTIKNLNATQTFTGNYILDNLMNFLNYMIVNKINQTNQLNTTIQHRLSTLPLLNNYDNHNNLKTDDDLISVRLFQDDNSTLTTKDNSNSTSTTLIVNYNKTVEPEEISTTTEINESSTDSSHRSAVNIVADEVTKQTTIRLPVSTDEQLATYSTTTAMTSSVGPVTTIEQNNILTGLALQHKNYDTENVARLKQTILILTEKLEKAEGDLKSRHISNSTYMLDNPSTESTTPNRNELQSTSNEYANYPNQFKSRCGASQNILNLNSARKRYLMTRRILHTYRNVGNRKMEDAEQEILNNMKHHKFVRNTDDC